MKYKVQLYVGGQTWWFECYANSIQEAKQVASAQHPNARIIGATATFLWTFKTKVFLILNQEIQMVM